MGSALPELWLLEDSEADAEVFGHAAEVAELGASVRYFQSGDALLSAAALAEGASRPALALLDLNLPGLDGRELITRLKESAAFRSVPLVVLSSSSNRNDVERAYEAGACAYLVKPLGIERYEELLRSIRDFWFGPALRHAAPLPPI